MDEPGLLQVLVAGEATPGGGSGGLVAVVLPVSATVFAERGERLAFADGTVGVEQDFHRAERIAQQVELFDGAPFLAQDQVVADVGVLPTAPAVVDLLETPLVQVDGGSALHRLQVALALGIVGEAAEAGTCGNFHGFIERCVLDLSPRPAELVAASVIAIRPGAGAAHGVRSGLGHPAATSTELLLGARIAAVAIGADTALAGQVAQGVVGKVLDHLCAIQGPRAAQQSIEVIVAQHFAVAAGVAALQQVAEAIVAVAQALQDTAALARLDARQPAGGGLVVALA